MDFRKRALLARVWSLWSCVLLVPAAGAQQLEINCFDPATALLHPDVCRVISASTPPQSAPSAATAVAVAAVKKGPVPPKVVPVKQPSPPPSSSSSTATSSRDTSSTSTSSTSTSSTSTSSTSTSSTSTPSTSTSRTSSGGTPSVQSTQTPRSTISTPPSEEDIWFVADNPLQGQQPTNLAARRGLLPPVIDISGLDIPRLADDDALSTTSTTSTRSTTSTDSAASAATIDTFAHALARAAANLGQPGLSPDARVAARRALRDLMDMAPEIASRARPTVTATGDPLTGLENLARTVNRARDALQENDRNFAPDGVRVVQIDLSNIPRPAQPVMINAHELEADLARQAAAQRAAAARAAEQRAQMERDAAAPDQPDTLGMELFEHSLSSDASPSAAASSSTPQSRPSLAEITAAHDAFVGENLPPRRSVSQDLANDDFGLGTPVTPPNRLARIAAGQDPDEVPASEALSPEHQRLLDRIDRLFTLPDDLFDDEEVVVVASPLPPSSAGPAAAPSTVSASDDAQSMGYDASDLSPRVSPRSAAAARLAAIKRAATEEVDARPAEAPSAAPSPAPASLSPSPLPSPRDPGPDSPRLSPLHRQLANLQQQVGETQTQLKQTLAAASAEPKPAAGSSSAVPPAGPSAATAGPSSAEIAAQLQQAQADLAARARNIDPSQATTAATSSASQSPSAEEIALKRDLAALQDDMAAANAAADAARYAAVTSDLEATIAQMDADTSPSASTSSAASSSAPQTGTRLKFAPDEHLNQVREYSKLAPPKALNQAQEEGVVQPAAKNPAPTVLREPRAEELKSSEVISGVQKLLTQTLQADPNIEAASLYNTGIRLLETGLQDSPEKTTLLVEGRKVIDRLTAPQFVKELRLEDRFSASSGNAVDTYNEGMDWVNSLAQEVSRNTGLKRKPNELIARAIEAEGRKVMADIVAPNIVEGVQQKLREIQESSASVGASSAAGGSENDAASAPQLAQLVRQINAIPTSLLKAPFPAQTKEELDTLIETAYESKIDAVQNRIHTLEKGLAVAAGEDPNAVPVTPSLGGDPAGVVPVLSWVQATAEKARASGKTDVPEAWGILEALRIVHPRMTDPIVDVGVALAKNLPNADLSNLPQTTATETYAEGEKRVLEFANQTAGDNETLRAALYRSGTEQLAQTVAPMVIPQIEDTYRRINQQAAMLQEDRPSEEVAQTLRRLLEEGDKIGQQFVFPLSPETVAEANALVQAQYDRLTKAIERTEGNIPVKFVAQSELPQDISFNESEVRALPRDIQERIGTLTGLLAGARKVSQEPRSLTNEAYLSRRAAEIGKLSLAIESLAKNQNISLQGPVADFLNNAFSYSLQTAQAVGENPYKVYQEGDPAPITPREQAAIDNRISVLRERLQEAEEKFAKDQKYEDFVAAGAAINADLLALNGEYKGRKTPEITQALADLAWDIPEPREAAASRSAGAAASTSAAGPSLTPQEEALARYNTLMTALEMPTLAPGASSTEVAQKMAALNKYITGFSGALSGTGSLDDLAHAQQLQAALTALNQTKLVEKAGAREDFDTAWNTMDDVLQELDHLTLQQQAPAAGSSSAPAAEPPMSDATVQQLTTRWSEDLALFQQQFEADPSSPLYNNPAAFQRIVEGVKNSMQDKIPVSTFHNLSPAARQQFLAVWTSIPSLLEQATASAATSQPASAAAARPAPAPLSADDNAFIGERLIRVDAAIKWADETFGPGSQPSREDYAELEARMGEVRANIEAIDNRVPQVQQAESLSTQLQQKWDQATLLRNLAVERLKESAGADSSLSTAAGTTAQAAPALTDTQVENLVDDWTVRLDFAQKRFEQDQDAQMLRETVDLVNEARLNVLPYTKFTQLSDPMKELIRGIGRQEDQLLKLAAESTPAAASSAAAASAAPAPLSEENAALVDKNLSFVDAQIKWADETFGPGSTPSREDYEALDARMGEVRANINEIDYQVSTSKQPYALYGQLQEKWSRAHALRKMAEEKLKELAATSSAAAAASTSAQTAATPASQVEKEISDQFEVARRIIEGEKEFFGNTANKPTQEDYEILQRAVTQAFAALDSGFTTLQKANDDQLEEKFQTQFMQLAGQIAELQQVARHNLAPGTAPATSLSPAPGDEEEAAEGDLVFDASPEADEDEDAAPLKAPAAPEKSPQDETLSDAGDEGEETSSMGSSGAGTYGSPSVSPQSSLGDEEDAGESPVGSDPGNADEGLSPLRRTAAAFSPPSDSDDEADDLGSPRGALSASASAAPSTSASNAPGASDISPARASRAPLTMEYDGILGAGIGNAPVDASAPSSDAPAPVSTLSPLLAQLQSPPATSSSPSSPQPVPASPGPQSLSTVSASAPTPTTVSAASSSTTSVSTSSASAPSSSGVKKPRVRTVTFPEGLPNRKTGVGLNTEAPYGLRATAAGTQEIARTSTYRQGMRVQKPQTGAFAANLGPQQRIAANVQALQAMLERTASSPETNPSALQDAGNTKLKELTRAAMRSYQIQDKEGLKTFYSPTPLSNKLQEEGQQAVDSAVAKLAVQSLDLSDLPTTSFEDAQKAAATRRQEWLKTQQGLPRGALNAEAQTKTAEALERLVMPYLQSQAQQIQTTSFQAAAAKSEADPVGAVKALTEGSQSFDDILHQTPLTAALKAQTDALQKEQQQAYAQQIRDLAPRVVQQIAGEAKLSVPDLPSGDADTTATRLQPLVTAVENGAPKSWNLSDKSKALASVLSALYPEKYEDRYAAQSALIDSSSRNSSGNFGGMDDGAGSTSAAAGADEPVNLKENLAVIQNELARAEAYFGQAVGRAPIRYDYLARNMDSLRTEIEELQRVEPANTELTNALAQVNRLSALAQTHLSAAATGSRLGWGWGAAGQADMPLAEAKKQADALEKNIVQALQQLRSAEENKNGVEQAQANLRVAMEAANVLFRVAERPAILTDAPELLRLGAALTVAQTALQDPQGQALRLNITPNWETEADLDLQKSRVQRALEEDDDADTGPDAFDTLYEDFSDTDVLSQAEQAAFAPFVPAPRSLEVERLARSLDSTSFRDDIDILSDQAGRAPDQREGLNGASFETSVVALYDAITAQMDSISLSGSNEGTSAGGEPQMARGSAYAQYVDLRRQANALQKMAAGTLGIDLTQQAGGAGDTIPAVVSDAPAPLPAAPDAADIVIDGDMPDEVQQGDDDAVSTGSAVPTPVPAPAAADEDGRASTSSIDSNVLTPDSLAAAGAGPSASVSPIVAQIEAEEKTPPAVPPLTMAALPGWPQNVQPNRGRLNAGDDDLSEVDSSFGDEYDFEDGDAGDVVPVVVTTSAGVTSAAMAAAPVVTEKTVTDPNTGASARVAMPVATLASQLASMSARKKVLDYTHMLRENGAAALVANAQSAVGVISAAARQDPSSQSLLVPVLSTHNALVKLTKLDDSQISPAAREALWTEIHALRDIATRGGWDIHPCAEGDDSERCNGRAEEFPL